MFLSQSFGGERWFFISPVAIEEVRKACDGRSELPVGFEMHENLPAEHVLAGVGADGQLVAVPNGADMEGIHLADGLEVLREMFLVEHLNEDLVEG